MVTRQYTCEHPAEGKADKNGLVRAGRVHHGKHVGHVVAERVGRHVLRPDGFAITAPVVGDAAEAFAEIGQLRLVDARVGDAPRRHEHDGLRTVAINLVMKLHTVAIDEPFLGRHLGAHDVTSSIWRTTFSDANKITDAPQRLTHRKVSLLKAKKIVALCTGERATDQSRDFLDRERAEAAELAFSTPRELRNQIDPAQKPGANDLCYGRISPACRDQFLKNPHVAGSDIFIEIVARSIPLL